MKKQHISNQSGFSLVEMMVTLIILSVLGVMVAAIVSGNFRGQSKATLINTVKQSGQVALDQLDKQIRFADEAFCAAPTSDTLIVLNDGIYSRFRFVAPTATENGYIGVDQPNISLNGPIASDCTDPQSTPVSLSSRGAQGISIHSGSFTRIQNLSAKDTITINFLAFPSLQSGLNVEDTLPNGIHFNTTVAIR